LAREEPAAKAFGGSGTAGSPGLIPLANRPLAAHILDELAAVGVRQVTVVGNALVTAELRSALLSTAPAGMEINFAAYGDDHVMRRFSDEAPLIIHNGECLLDGGLVQLAARLAQDGLDALVVNSPEEPDASPRNLFASPAQRAGIHVFGPGTMRMLDPQVWGSIDADTFDDLCARLLEHGERVETVAADRGWRYEDGPDGLLAANRLLLEHLEPDVPEHTLEHTEVQGPLIVHPTALISHSIVRGPAIVGPMARVTGAYVGPYTAIGGGAVIDNAEIENSIVMERAVVRDLGHRLESSVVGADARVTRRFSLPRAVQVFVGAKSRVSLI
jgi:glucose-1-phosphate thymidylyltransferase